MTQITLNIEDKSILPHLKKVLGALKGVSIATTTQKRKKCGLEQALEEVKEGKVKRFETVDDLFQDLGI